jgi:predicted nucleotidyltransferase
MMLAHPPLTPFDLAREREIKAMIVNVLRANAARLEGRKVVLFGSRARGEARPRSDFDLGVMGDQPMPDHTMTASTSAK